MKRILLTFVVLMAFKGVTYAADAAPAAAPAADAVAPAPVDIGYMIERAKSGDQLFIIELARRYKEGDGVEINTQQAKYWYEQAVKGGNPDGHFFLGLMYGNGDFGLEDKITACKQYEKAVAMEKKGEIYSHSHNNLAVCYADGIGCKKDYSKAVKHYQIAAKHPYAHI